MGDSQKRVPHLLSGKAELAALEAERVTLGFSVYALARRAGMTTFNLVRTLEMTRRPRAHTLTRLRQALKALAGERQTAPGAEMVLATYDLFVAHLAPQMGVTPEDVRQADPRRGATADARWAAARHVAQAAIYLTNTALQVRQRQLADVLGLTPAAICLACQSVEDRRDDPRFDAMLTAAAAIVRREAA